MPKSEYTFWDIDPITSGGFSRYSRESLPNLPYSVTEIYGIRTSGHYGGLKQHFNEFYRIYGSNLIQQKVHPETVITEDSNAGYQLLFFMKK